jgi:hypothetical protein
MEDMTTSRSRKERLNELTTTIAVVVVDRKEKALAHRKSHSYFAKFTNLRIHF